MSNKITFRKRRIKKKITKKKKNKRQTGGTGMDTNVEEGDNFEKKEYNVDEGYPGSPGREESGSQDPATQDLSQAYDDMESDDEDGRGSSAAAVTATSAAAVTATSAAAGTATAAAAVRPADVLPMLVYCMDSISSSLSGTMGIYIPPTIVETLSSEFLRKQTRKKSTLTLQESLDIYDRLNDRLYLSVKSYLEKLIPHYDVDLLNRSLAATEAFCLNEILRYHYIKSGAVDDKLSDLIKRNIGLLYYSGDIDVGELSVMLRGLKEYNSYIQVAIADTPTLKDEIILSELQNPNTFKSFDDYIKNQLIRMMSEKGFYLMLFDSEDVRTKAIELFSNLNDNLSMVVGLILHDISEIFATQLVKKRKKDNEDLINKVIGLFIEIPIKLIVINMLIDKDLPNDLDSYLYAIEGVSNDYATSDIDDDDDSGMAGGAETIDADMPAAASADPEETLYVRAQKVIMEPVPYGGDPYESESDRIDKLIEIMHNSLKISQERSQAEEAAAKAEEEAAKAKAEEEARLAKEKAEAEAAEARKIEQARKAAEAAEARRKAAKQKAEARKIEQARKAAEAAEARRKAAKQKAEARKARRKAAKQEAEARKAAEAKREAELAAEARRKAPQRAAEQARGEALVAAAARADNSKKRKPKEQLSPAQSKLSSAESKKKTNSTKAEVTGIQPPAAAATAAEVTGIQPRAAAQAQPEGVINPAAAEAEGATAAAETAATQRPYPSQNRGEGTTAPVAKAARRDNKLNKKGGMSLLQYQTGGSNESYYLYQENLHLIIKRLLIKLKIDLQKANVENLNYYSATYDVCLKFLMIHEESENIKKDGSKLIKKMQEAVINPTAEAAAAEAEVINPAAAAAAKAAEAAEKARGVINPAAVAAVEEAEAQGLLNPIRVPTKFSNVAVSGKMKTDE